MIETKEIGSEFWAAETGGSSPFNRKTYLSGRTALTAIILDLIRRGLKKVCLPDYCCESMVEPFLRQGMEIRFYKVSKTGTGIAFSFEETSQYDAVLLVNYFGFMTSEMKALLRTFKNAGISTILDLTHAVFSVEMESGADYVFGSYRKWTGAEAGFASGRLSGRLPAWDLNETGVHYLMLRENARRTKAEFVAGKYNSEALRQKQLSLFGEAEEYLDRSYLSDTDAENKRKISLLHTDFIKNKRRENAKTIFSFFSGLKLCEPVFPFLPDDCVPLTVPILVADGKRDSLRAFLREHGIFCPVHWPLNDIQQAESGALRLYEEELSLVCDQRYNIPDMTRMMEMIIQWEMTASA